MSGRGLEWNWVRQFTILRLDTTAQDGVLGAGDSRYLNLYPLEHMPDEQPENQNQQELPRYACHKKVWALKIAKFERRLPTIGELDRILAGKGEDGDGIGGFLTPSEKGYARFPVSIEYVQKHDPKEGGYYVVYDDGYKSFSPAKAFEDGYTRIV